MTCQKHECIVDYFLTTGIKLKDVIITLTTVCSKTPILSSKLPMAK